MEYFNDIFADMISNKKLHPVVTELFITGRKLSIYLLLIILPSTKGCGTKHYTLLHLEDSEQT